MLEWVSGPTLETVLNEFCRRIQATAAGPGGAYPVALTGGKSAAKFYDAWAAAGVSDRLRFFWSDERLVPLDDPDSNYRLSFEHLLGPGRVPPEHIHPAPVQLPAAACAEAYAQQIRQAVPGGQEHTPQFPLIILGLGEDGHTGSLFPGRDPYEDDDALVRAVAPTAQHPHRRISFTPRLINHAAQVWFVVTGAAKSWAVEQLALRSAGVQQVPALTVDPAQAQVTVFADPACRPGR